MNIKIKNINTRLIAGITAFTLFTTSLTGCASKKNDKFYYEKNDSGEYVSSNTVDIDYAKKYIVVVMEVLGKTEIYIARKVNYLYDHKANYDYCNIFGDYLIYSTFENNQNKNITDEQLLGDYLLYYGLEEKTEFTEEELRNILEQIKNDFFSEEKDKPQTRTKTKE